MKLCLLTWLAVQILVPFALKFEWPSLRYRWAMFSWGMYSAPIGEYEVVVYRIMEDGRRAPVPDIQSYLPELDPAGPVRMMTDYSPARVERNYEALVHRLAADRGDGATYVVSIDWLISSKAQPGHREIRYRDGS